MNPDLPSYATWTVGYDGSERVLWVQIQCAAASLITNAQRWRLI